ncbi:hypothetical protein DOTSEDRAFT_160857 [Dothistroma septosporum NZE10]|uniref:G-patch domain-containing protein n=1 Tax=Dothistroma septosporum (strain NZE10 / CBS 128990) TaxID=675120 RepID=M2YJB1_DOTSN|nr:hypothetical protein DOTSEDRAFT_160857 [Dothistroma septosporum NZE10]
MSERATYRPPRSDYRQERERKSDRHQSSNDDRYRSHYDSRSRDYYEQDYVDPSFYEEPEEPPASNGDSDVSPDGTPLQILLVRGLKNNVDEALLSKGLDKLYLDDDQQEQANQPPAIALPGAQSKPSPPGAAPQSLKRVFVIRDRVTEKSLGYGFAEYHSRKDAQGALAKANELGDKCTISSKQIEVCYPHLGVFPPVVIGQTDDNTRFLFQMDDGNFRKYHDTRYYASGSIVNAEPPARPESPSLAKDTTKTSKKRSNHDQASDTLENPDGVKKVKTGPAFTIAAQWQKKQAELRGEDEAADRDDTIPNSASGPNAEAITGYVPQSFVYHGERGGKLRTCCLLCATDLKANVSPADHVKGSAKHAENLKNEQKYQQGFENLKKWGVAEHATVQVEDDSLKQQPQYIDRAEERRKQEALTGTGEKFRMSLKTTNRKTKAPTTEESAPAAPTYGKGLNMLQKAGWKDGQGLGSGNGITAPVEQNVYAAGVGLGHEGSKKGDAVEEANRSTRGSFLEKTRDVARERFERMG